MDTRKRQRRQTNRKTQIVEAASQLVIKRGLEDISLTAFAAAAGISKGTLYYYYPTKEALIFDIAEKHVRDITDFIFDLIDANDPVYTPEALLRLLFRKHKRNLVRMRLHLNLVCQAMNGNADLQKRYQEVYAYWHERAAEALERMFPDHRDRTTLAHLMITTIDGLNVQTMLGIDTVSSDDAARFLASSAGT